MAADRQRPRCLALLATYNGAQFVTQQIESILSQLDVAVDILLGDDASTDNTLETVQQVDDRGSIRICRRSTGTGSAAQNFAQLIREADASNYDYVALSDQDDIWMTDKLRAATDKLTTSGAGGYSCSVIACWPGGRESVLRQSPRLRKADFLFEGAGQGCTFVLTRKLFERVQETFRRRPDLTARLIYHDWAIYAIARALDVPWTFDHTPHIWYRQHAGNDTGARYSMSGLHRRLNLFLSGQYRTQIAAIMGLIHDVTPRKESVLQWEALQSIRPIFVRRFCKAVFCLRHGRRRLTDRMVTALTALAGWV